MVVQHRGAQPGRAAAAPSHFISCNCPAADPEIFFEFVMAETAQVGEGAARNRLEIQRKTKNCLSS